MQHYVIMFVSDLRQVVSFLRVLRFLSPTKLTVHDIIPILLKVALNTINPNLQMNCPLKTFMTINFKADSYITIKMNLASKTMLPEVAV